MSEPRGLSPHVGAVEKAAELYKKSFDADDSSIRWLQAKQEAEKLVDSALDASLKLRDIEAALRKTGIHTRAFRYMLAPPLSQDQFELHCKSWSKSSEKSGTPLKPEVASEVAAILLRRRDKSLTRWIDLERAPTAQELSALRASAISLIAMQSMGTATRTRSSADQERAVIESLLRNDWRQVPAVPILSQGALKKGEFAHKVKCATETEPQEADVACGIDGRVILAMECKVSNDRTNSIKRVNDVLKKAKAWKSHWGSFVKTAALLQGVFKPADVDRLSKEGVAVFWSHDLEGFVAWLKEEA